MQSFGLNRLLFCSFVLIGCLLEGAVAAANLCEADRERWQCLDRLPSFQEPLAHPLIGQVYDARSPSAVHDMCPGRALNRLVQSLRTEVSQPYPAGDGPRFLVLGEMHDNPAHHILRAELLRSIFSDRPGQTPPLKAPAIIFEHIQAGQQEAVDAVTAGAGSQPLPEVVNQLFAALSWKTSGWPDQKLFEPLFSIALETHMPILAGNAPSAIVNKISAEGFDALPVAERKRFRRTGRLSPALRDALLSELEASHCGLLPKVRFKKMAIAQRYRDSHLALALSDAGARTGSAVLLAGNGHARKDRGVPSFFGHQGLQGKPISVMLIEVEDGRNDAQDYVPMDPNGEPAADFIIFTPGADRKDPCIEMRSRFSKPKE